MNENVSKNVSSKLTFFLAGAGIGATVALLFAPKKGRELRGDIADAANRSVDYVADEAREIGHEVTDLYTTGKDKASKLIESGKELITERKETIAAAIEAGKKAYQEKKGESLVASAK